MAEAVIVSAVRTPIGRANKGVLKDVRADDLAAIAVRAAVERVPQLDRALIEDVILGCAFPEGEQGMNLARLVGALAGLPETAGGVTVNRFCASSLQAVNMAAQSIMLGQGDVIVAGGVESMSRVPMGSDSRVTRGVSDRSGVGDGGNAQLRARFRQVPQGISADVIATLDRIGRDEIDAFALASQRNAATAIAEGHFARSLVPVCDRSSGTIILDRDECPRPTTAEGLASLPPSFAALGETLDDVALTQLRATVARGRLAENDRMAFAAQFASGVTHVHTAGNSSGIADGAAALLVTSAAYASAHGLVARARVRAMVSSQLLTEPRRLSYRSAWRNICANTS